MDTNSKNKDQVYMKTEEEGKKLDSVTSIKEQEDDVFHEVEFIEKGKRVSEESDNTSGQEHRVGRGKGFVPRTFLTLVLIVALSTMITWGLGYVHDMNKANSEQAYLNSYDFAQNIEDLTNRLIGKAYAIEQGRSGYDSFYEEPTSLKYYINKGNETLITNLENLMYVNKEMEATKFYLRIKTDKTAKAIIESNSHSNNLRGKIENLFQFNRSEFQISDEEKIILEEEYNQLGTVEADHLNQEYGYIKIMNANGELIKEINNVSKQQSMFYMKYNNLDIGIYVDNDMMNYNDTISRSYKYYMVDHYVVYIIIFGLTCAGAMFLLFLLIPYRFQEKIPLCILYNKMFLELKIGLLILLGICAMSIVNNINYRLYTIWISDVVNRVDAGFYIAIIMICLLSLMIYLNTVYLKSIYYKGVTEAFLRNSIVYRLISSIWRRVVALFTIDIRRVSSQLLIGAGIIYVGVIFISIISNSIEVFILSTFVAACIMIVGLKILKKLIKIDEITSELAKGDFDIAIDDKSNGMLKPIFHNLKHVQEGFRVAVDRATKSQQMKTELISNVSHDLKTPLTSIITYVDLLKDENLDEEKRREYTEVLDSMSKRLKVLIEDLFEASRASTGNIDMNLECIDINALLRQTLGEMEEKLNSSSLMLRLNIPEEPVMCELDGRRTYRVFENILNNILKYAMKGTRVYIDVEEKEKDVDLIFRNMSAYEMNFNVEQITERFTRGDTSRHTEGSGLGLSIAKSLVELQKGTIQIDIDGDLFKLTISFPKVKDVQEESIL